MYIESLSLKTFRNYESVVIDFSPKVNFITGENGSGKTNILEAVSVLANIKSFKGISDQDIVKWGYDSYYISADIEDNDYNKFEIGFSFLQNRTRKKVKIDDAEIHKASNYYGKLLAVIISPGDINIINGGPELRRRFFDSVISKFDESYYDALNDFKKTVVNRNSLLKQLREKKIRETKDLEPWDILFAKKSSILIAKRIEFIKSFKEIFSQTYKKIASPDKGPDIEYINSAGVASEQELLNELSKRRIKDILSGSCSIGPHRDDFLLKNNEGIHFTNYGSQGQRRTAAISLKLAEREITEEKLGKKSVILVDDIFSELDENRRKKMVDLLSSGNQVIFTMVNINSVDLDLFQDSKLYEVKENKILNSLTSI